MVPLLLLSLISTSCAFYSSSDAVVNLTPANFDTEVTNSDSLWIIEFYAPWCGHCQQLTPEWKKAALALKGFVKIGAADVDNHQALGQRFGIQGFPTIKVFGGDKAKPTDYNGQRSASAIVEEAARLAKTMIQDRMAGKGGKSGDPTHSESEESCKREESNDSESCKAKSESYGSSKSGGSGGKKGNPADVIELTTTSFDKDVMGSKDMWLVEFYAPWCGHCKKLAPEWASAASTLKGKAKLGAVDATQFPDLAQRYGIRGYPTIKYFPAGPKLDAEEYDGGRTAGDIVTWVENKAESFAEPPEIRELLNDDIFKEECREKSICLVSILPDILDTGAKGRNEYIEVLKAMGDKYKKRGFGWVWSAPGEQDKLQEALEIGGAGYPALAALNIKKTAVLHHRGGFSSDSINEFLQYVIAGRIAPSILRNDVPKLRKAAAWDGKDGQLPEEEDYSDLDDMSLDDIKSEL